MTAAFNDYAAKKLRKLWNLSAEAGAVLSVSMQQDKRGTLAAFVIMDIGGA